jgi:hypothetical protein
VILLGGDPAKPGLELILVAPLIISYSLGATIGHYLVVLISKEMKKRNIKKGKKDTHNP